MAAAILTQGLTNIRDALRGVAGNFITNVGVTDDSVAFAANQTTLNPTAGTTVTLIQTATATVVDAQTIDYTMVITGATQFTNKQIWCIGVCTSATAVSAMSRSVRTLSIGVQSGDIFTVGVRVKDQDDS